MTARPDVPDRTVTRTCQENDPDLWFPEDEEEEGAEAVALCFDLCPRDTRMACLKGAVERREPYGIWGGWTTAERRELLTRRTA